MNEYVRGARLVQLRTKQESQKESEDALDESWKKEKILVYSPSPH